MARIRTATASFTRPSNTTAYAAGDLVANNATAGSVTPMTFTFQTPNNLWLTNLTIRKTKADITNASFRLWFLSSSPTVTNGDNGAIAGDFLSTILFEPVQVDVYALMTSSGAVGTSIFDEGLLRLPPTSYGLLEALGAYTPASAEVFTFELQGAVF